MTPRQLIQLSSALCLSFAWGQAAIAQPIPDPSLGTQVSSQDGLNFLILGGRSAGANLFHSFSDFSVAPSGSASFTTAPNIERIFSRVSGTAPSRINGLVQANADLFLLNPNGILFGPSGQLRVNGSFLGTTAQSLNFADGVQFIAQPEGAAPELLSLSQPLGLNLSVGQKSVESLQRLAPG